MTKKLIIDTDTGIDDAIAILMALAAPDCEIVAVTTVSGNVPLDLVTRNVGIVLNAAGVDPIPIFRGSDRPLLAPAVHAASVHGQDGLGDAGFPTLARRVEPEPAAQALVRTARENPGATLIALGPLTNVALALALEPNLPNLLAEAVLMGGAVRAQGNATPVAEFNIYADAEAAAMVFARGLNPTVLSWEATLETPVQWEIWDRLLSAGPLGNHFVAPMVVGLTQRGHARGHAGILMPDPLAMAVVLDPECATTYPARVEVDTGWGAGRGLTAVDALGRGGRTANAQIVSEVNQERFTTLLERAFRMECHLAREV
ncbi:MAG TPA: nucleoside hydrolase [Roseiflexaceae bacterium]|jgi:purine nucleosidase